MGNMLRPPEHKKPDHHKLKKRRFSFDAHHEEPTVHGISFLPENQKKKWRRQTRKKLKIAFREKPSPTSRTDEEKEEVEEEVEEVEVEVEVEEESPLNENSELDGIQCEIVSCDMNNSSSSSTTSEAPNLKSLSASWDDPSKHSFPFENLILSGGGSKGYAYLGAAKGSPGATTDMHKQCAARMQALEDSGVMKNIKRVAGTSAGAICAGLLAVGASAQEVADVFKCDIKWLFHDQTCACCCGLPKMLSSAYGVHPAKRFLKIYGEHIAAKVGNPDITFGELYEKYGRELCIVVTNLTRMKSEYCHPKTTPDMPIRTAVRMSMSFPLVYKAMKYSLNGVESLYTDGGVLDQYPIHCFDGPKLDLNISSETTDENENTEKTEELSNLAFNDKSLGLYVVSEKALDYKIWKSLFERELPCKPTYLPDTKLARTRLKDELSNRKRRDKTFNKKEYLGDLKSSAMMEDAVEAVNLDHYQIHNRSLVDIRSFGEYFITTLETLLVSQRKLQIRPCDVNRTVAINCGYIATNDYDIEPGDREFMIRQGYAHTMRFLQEHIRRTTEGPHPTLRRTRTEPANLSNGHVGNGLRRTASEIPNPAETVV